jgi:UDP-2-acetamido-2,6-beta-L-arabino-hexul-4-ose reductase
MKVLVTGAMGFIGRNLVAELSARKEIEVQAFDVDIPPEALDAFCRDCEFVFHLAGVNRPKDPDDYMAGNKGFTETLVESLDKAKNRCPVAAASSTQAALDNPYGRSKRAMEEVLEAHRRASGAPVWIFRLPNVFGKWCRPNYNSAVATFCHNLANGLLIQVNDPAAELSLVHIDDVVRALIEKLESARARANDPSSREGFAEVSPVYRKRLGDIVAALLRIRDDREALRIPDVSDDFIRKLSSTYQTYLPPERIRVPLATKSDPRGSFTEMIKSPSGGQVSVNVIKPGQRKGNHWHHTKFEKFITVFGRGVVRMRRIDETEVREYAVDGERIDLIEIPSGHTHNIENLGTTDMVIVMWANEPFDPERPDTFFQEV